MVFVEASGVLTWHSCPYVFEMAEAMVSERYRNLLLREALVAKVDGVRALLALDDV
jgi:hypothetical protein